MPPFQFSLRVFNSAGELVGVAVDRQGSFSMPTSLRAEGSAFTPDGGGLGLVEAVGTGMVLGWNGRNSAGQYVNSGAYTLVLETKDPFGVSTTFSATLSVIRAPQSLQVSIFNSAGERVRQFSSTAPAPATALPPRLSSPGFVPKAEGGADLSIRYGSAPGDAVIWDGRNDQGTRVASGTYLITITTQRGNAKSAWDQDVVLMSLQDGGPLVGAFAAPNPASGTGTWVHLPAATPGQAVHARAFNLAGECVAELSSDDANRPMLWPFGDGSPASGVYLLALDCRDAQGLLRRQILKVAVTR